MKARHASEGKKAKEGDDPSDSKAEQGDMVGVPVREEVDVEEVPGAAEAGDEIVEEGVEGGHQAIVTIVLKTVKSRQRKCRSRLSGGRVALKDGGRWLPLFCHCFSFLCLCHIWDYV